MDLYSLVGADQHVDPDGNRYTPDLKTGAFHFPDEVSDLIGGFAVKGKKLWETEAERAERLHSADLAAQRDPASLYSVVAAQSDTMVGIADLVKTLAARRIAEGPAAALSPADEIAALRTRLAELEGASGGREDAPGAESDVVPAPGPALAPAKPARASKGASKPGPAGA